MPPVDVLLRDHVTLQCECIDRLYLNGYIPTLQMPWDLASFLIAHRKQKIASPALLGHMSDRFVKAINAFSQAHNIPMMQFPKGERKEDIVRPYFQKARAGGRQEAVVLIGVAQERVTAFRATKPAESQRPGIPFFRFHRASVFVNQYYFYILDRDFGPTFIKFSSYAPFSVRVCLNGHEWVKCRMASEGIGFEELDNGFLAADDAERLQAVCDDLSQTHIEQFFERWLDILPSPFSTEDRQAGFRHRLSILQMEISLTQVFDRPLYGRQFFEEVIRDHLDLGRPDRVQLVFGRRVTRRTPGKFRTRVLTNGVEPSLHVDYKHSKIKQYFKLGRALRTETTINDTYDFGVKRGIRNFEYLRTLGQHTNWRLLRAQSAASPCQLSANTFEEVVLPSIENGQRVPGLRFGDPRVMALLSALCGFFHLLDGFRNADLRARMAALLDQGTERYSAGKMTYDLRRLLLNGLIQRIEGKHRYMATPRGLRVASLFVKTYTRILKRAPVGLDPPALEGAPALLQHAWRKMDAAIVACLKQARLAA